MVIQNGYKRSSSFSQSRDHSELLDVIDNLRSQGVSNYVPLPQIIVCGDQSSGKSSVLEAISGVRFPTKDSVCTRFATELILRREEQMKITVGITPGKDRSDEEKATLLAFNYPDAQLEDFPSFVEAAKEAMGLNSDTKSFSSDILRVEVSGPNQENLTLVDLPGLIHAESKQKGTSDISSVKSLVELYIAQSRSIILAVVSAKNDLANQIVTMLARDVDPQGLRTMGIITKPDTLHLGSDSEKDFVKLAKNEEVKFRLGWHVLKNRDYAQRDFSTEERDSDEISFFSKGIWTTLPTNVLGLGPLKPRLSVVLQDQIISELPSLIRDVEKGIDDCQNRLAKLGDSRATLSEQRRYIMQVGQNFGSLMKEAISGVYADDFFGSAISEEGYSKRLRAVVQNLLLDFASEMRSNGHELEIVDESFDDEYIGISQPPKVSRAEYISEVRKLMSRSRGCELPGMFNPMIIGDLFFQQSRPWKAIVHSYCQTVLDATRTCIDLILIHLADDQTRSGLHREVVDPAVEAFSRTLHQRVSELMKPHQKGHAITYNPRFIETMQKAREDLLEISEKGKDQDMEFHACSKATDYMKSYYEVAMMVVVDNIAVLGVEFSLLGKLSGLLSPDVVMNLDDSVVQGIAAEHEASQIERARALSKHKILQGALDILRRYGRHKPEILHFDIMSEINGQRDRFYDDSPTSDQFGIVRGRAKKEAALGSPEATSQAETSAPASPLSPFTSSGSIRSDTWLKTVPKRSSTTKKTKKRDLVED